MRVNPHVAKIGITVLALLAFLIRIEPTLLGKTHFSIDQALDASLVKKLVVDVDMSLISRYTGLEGVFMGPWYTWFMAPIYRISGGNPHADVWYLSLLMVGAGFLFGRWMYHRFSLEAAVLATSLVWFSPFFISASQIVYSPSPVVPLVLAIIVVWYEIVFKNRVSLLPILAFLIVMTTQFEVGFAVFFIPAIVMVSFVIGWNRVRIPRQLWLASLLVATVPLLPQIGFEIRNNWLMTHSVIRMIQGETSSLGSANLGWSARGVSRLESMSQDLGYTFSLPQEIVVTIFVTGIMFVLLVISKTKTSHVTGAFLAIIGLFYLGLWVYPGPVWGWYRVGIPPLMVCVMAIVISEFLQSRRITWVVYALSAWWILWGLNPFARIEAWSMEPDSVSSLGVQHQVLDALYEKANGQPFSLYVYTPPVYPYLWDYQLYHYARPRFGYLPKPYDIMPQTGNPDLVYLLIEPDVEQPTRIEGWLGNFRALGYQKEIWELPAGIRLVEWKFESEPKNAVPLTRFVDILDEQ